MKPHIELNSSKTEFVLKKNFYQLDIKSLQKESLQSVGKKRRLTD